MKWPMGIIFFCVNSAVFGGAYQNAGDQCARGINWHARFDSPQYFAHNGSVSAEKIIKKKSPELIQNSHEKEQHVKDRLYTLFNLLVLAYFIGNTYFLIKDKYSPADQKSWFHKIFIAKNTWINSFMPRLATNGVRHASFLYNLLQIAIETALLRTALKLTVVAAMGDATDVLEMGAKVVKKVCTALLSA